MRFMSSIRFLIGALALFISSASLAGFSISNGQLVDNNGVPFVMRGMAYPFAWFTQRYPSQTQQDIVNMSATRANTVRFVLGTGAQFTRSSGAQVAQLIQWAKDNRMIAVLEVHDSTGWSESTPAAPISNAVAYWTSSDIRAAINGQENFVIINIANEPFGNTTTSNYTPNTISAIQSLRNAGITHTLMVDAANWGQDWSNTMRSNATQIWNADTRRNLVFSVHMYEVYAQASAVTSYMQAFDDMSLPLVIGEFGADHQGQAVDEGTIMAQAQQRGNGYLGWSWSGNGSCCASLDIVSNFGTALTNWGQILVNGTNGIRATSVPATVFPTGGSNLTVSPAAISLAAAASSAPVQVTANVSWNATDNQSWLSVAPTAGTNNGSFTVSATGNTGATSRTGTVTVSGGGISRTISVSQAGQSGTGGIVSNGTYRVLARHSGKALDVSGHGTADGSNVIQWAYGGGNNQRWTLTHLGSNVYSIIGVESGKALEVASTSTANGTNVDVRTYTGANNQRWTISATSGGYFRLSPVSSSGSALDVSGVSTADGANVQQWSWGSGNNQQWIFQTP